LLYDPKAKVLSASADFPMTPTTIGTVVRIPKPNSAHPVPPLILIEFFGEQ
jgi:hypothetical protein